MRVIFFSAAGVFILLLVGATLINDPRASAGEKDLTIALRQIGHSILLQAGDITSRVLPVKETEPNVFLLEFQSSFTYIPDSLVKAVTSALTDNQLQPYIVHVIDCSSKEIMYGFQIGIDEETTLVPCVGRVQPKACYQIKISFPETGKSDSLAIVIYTLAIMASGSLMLGFILSRKKQKQVRSTSSSTSIQIGAFSFYPEDKLLIHSHEKIELSEKENKLLSIFANHQNEIVSRDLLMKTVWEDEGVIVGRSLDVFVSKLRKKLKADSTVQLANIHGVGYRLESKIN